MPMSHFSHFLDGVSIRGKPIQQLYPGKIFWVNGSSVLAENARSGSNGNRGDYLSPFATIAYAITQCVASRGDIICVMPNHVETIAASSTLALSVAGVAIVGLGHGSIRPNISVTGTSGFISVSAANCSLVNVLITGDIDAITKVMNIAAADFAMQDVEYRDGSGKQPTTFILTTAAADRLDIRGLRYRGDSAAGSSAAIRLVGGDGFHLDDFDIRGNFSQAAIEIITTASTNSEIRNGHIHNLNSADVAILDTITGSTGRIGPNLYLRCTDNAANITEAVTGATFVVFDDVYVVNLAGEKAMLINWTASTDA